MTRQSVIDVILPATQNDDLWRNPTFCLLRSTRQLAMFHRSTIACFNTNRQAKHSSDEPFPQSIPTVGFTRCAKRLEDLTFAYAV
jgi:hypothetical protein